MQNAFVSTPWVACIHGILDTGTHPLPRSQAASLFSPHAIRRWIDKKHATPAFCACAYSGPRHHIHPQRKSGCSSVVEHFLAKEDVARSNRVTRSINLRKVDGTGKGLICKEQVSSKAAPQVTHWQRKNKFAGCLRAHAPPRNAVPPDAPAQPTWLR